MVNDKNTPVLIGAAQYLQPKDTEKPLDPLSLMVKTCQAAIADSGALEINNYIDAVYMVNINSWSYDDAPGQLSKIIDVNPKVKVYLPDGGDTPQMLTNRAAKAITSRELQAVLITGGEAQYTSNKAKKKNTKLDWPEFTEPSYMEGPLWDGINKWENHYGLKIPPYTYALFETAVRASSGRTIQEHKEYMGKLFEHFAKVASKHPFAWSKEPFSAKEITTPSEVNRYINHPYTKRMCSNMFVDQSASLIITSETIADKLGIPRDKRVYLMGGADFKDVHEITRKPRLDNSPAMKAAANSALNQAGLQLKDINTFDFYSCFPSVVEIMMNELELDLKDGRDLTLTGGLPFFGGPWSNYSMHAIVTAIEHIRKNSNQKVMVIANGGYNSKKSVGIYGTSPPGISWDKRDDSELQGELLKDALPEPIKEAEGILLIEAYTIPYDRSGKPKYAIIIGKLESGIRTISSLMADPDYLLKFEKEELVGKKCKVKFDPNSKRNLANLLT